MYPSTLTGSAVTLKWNSVKGADQYVIYGAKCGSKMKQIGVVDSRTLSQKITGIKGDDLKKDTFYKFYVAALANGSHHKSVLLAVTSTIHEILKGSGKYANYTSIRLHSAKSIKLKKGKKTTIKAEQVTSSGAGTHAPVHRKVHYLSSNPKVAKVGKTSGKVTAVSAGTCKIYCFTQNGRYKTVSVKVR